MPRRSAVLVGRVVAGLAVAGLVCYLTVVGLDRADKLGSAAGMVVAVLGLIAPYLLPPRPRPPVEPEVSPERGPAAAAPGGIDVRDSQGVQVNLGDGTHTQYNFFQLLVRLPTVWPFGGRPAGLPGKPGTRTVLRRMARVIVPVTLVAATTTGIIWWRLPSDASPPSSTPASAATPATATPVRTAASPTWSVEVANAPSGLFAYPGPFSDPQHKKPAASLFEGDVLRVVCQERHGRVIADPTSVTSTVWYKLDTGVWVSHLYTDLFPEKAGRSRPAIPDCTY